MKYGDRTVVTHRRRALQVPAVAVSLLLGALLVLSVHSAFNHESGAPDYETSSRRNAGPLRERQKGSIVFTCSDGRVGLHVIHTRFLVNQSGTGHLFAASRLRLMDTFTMSSLREQTSLDFVLNIAHDPGLEPLTMSALKSMLNTFPSHWMLQPETSTTTMALNFKGFVQRLAEFDERVRSAQFFITSRLDIDDASHVGSVKAIQKYACSGGKQPPAVRLVYIMGGALWFPQHNSSLGQLRVPRPEYKIYTNLAVMQSMVLSGTDMIANCPLNVYSYPHYRPQALESKMHRPKKCPKFNFDGIGNVYRWRPPAGEYGWLYTKTNSSWTAGKLDHRKSSWRRPMDFRALRDSFALDAGEVAAANLLFLGLDSENPAILVNRSSLELE